jgi:hypothetical protein
MFRKLTMTPVGGGRSIEPTSLARMVDARLPVAEGGG